MGLEGSVSTMGPAGQQRAYQQCGQLASSKQSNNVASRPADKQLDYVASRPALSVLTMIKQDSLQAK